MAQHPLDKHIPGFIRNVYILAVDKDALLRAGVDDAWFQQLSEEGKLFNEADLVYDGEFGRVFRRCSQLLPLDHLQTPDGNVDWNKVADIIDSAVDTLTDALEPPPEDTEDPDKPTDLT